MPRPIKDLLHDIRQAALDLSEFMGQMGPEAFRALPETDPMRWRAIKNALSEIGEASNKIPQEVRDRHCEIDWRGPAALRNIIVHSYFGLNPTMLYGTIQESVPQLLGVVKIEILRADALDAEMQQADELDGFPVLK